MEAHISMPHIPLHGYIICEVKDLSCFYKVDCNLSLNQPSFLFQSHLAQSLEAQPHMQHIHSHSMLFVGLKDFTMTSHGFGLDNMSL